MQILTPKFWSKFDNFGQKFQKKNEILKVFFNSETNDIKKRQRSVDIFGI